MLSARIILFETTNNVITNLDVGSRITLDFKLPMDKMAALPLFEGTPVLCGLG